MNLRETTDKMFSFVFSALKGMQKDEEAHPIIFAFKNDAPGIIKAPPPERVGPTWQLILASVIKELHEEHGINGYVIGMETHALLGDSSFDAYVITAGDEERTVVRLWELQRDNLTGRYVSFIERVVPDDFSLMDNLSNLLVPESVLPAGFGRSGFLH